MRFGRTAKDKATGEAQDGDLFGGVGTQPVTAPDVAAAPAAPAQPQQPGSDATSAADQGRRAYYEQGMVWERHIYRRAVAHARLAWSIAGLSLLMLAASIGALLFTIPTIRYEPYVIAVDKTTGYMEMVRALKPGDLADDEAVTKANVWRYVLNRETFDRNTLPQNVRVAALLSRAAAARDLEELYAPSNPRALHRTTPDGVVISVQLKSINLLNPRVAQVRFSTERRELTQITVQHWVSIARFEYSRAPMRNEWRVENPLGFQVIEYRRDQESLPAPGAAGAG
jgi:type IV secretion system protein VirB8